MEHDDILKEDEKLVNVLRNIVVYNFICIYITIVISENLYRSMHLISNIKGLPIVAIMYTYFINCHRVILIEFCIKKGYYN